MGKLGTWQFVLVLAVLAGVAAFLELGRRDVLEDNEGQRATPPAEMVRSGNYVIPTLNGKDYLSKPPLLYWAIAGVYKATGTISPLTARIPTAIAYFVLVFGVYLIGRRHVGEVAGRWGALAMLTSPYVMQRGRYAELDIPLTLAIFLCLVAAHNAVLSKSRKAMAGHVLVGAVALGAAIMLKGPVPFLFLAGAFIAQLMTVNESNPLSLRDSIRIGRYTGIALLLAMAAWLTGLIMAKIGRMGSIFDYLTPLALLLVVATWLVPAWRKAGPARWRCVGVFAIIVVLGLALAAPWGAAVLERKGLANVIKLLQSESLERTHTATAINSGSPFYYFIGLLAMLLPWGLLLPCQASPKAWGKGPVFYRYAILTGWLSVLIFSLIAGKEYEYVMPAVPLLLLAMGWQLAVREDIKFERPVVKWFDLWQGTMLVLLTLAAAVFLILIFTKSQAMAVPGALLGAVAIAAAVLAWRRFELRAGAIPVLAFCAALLWLFSQDYRNTGKRSFRPLAETVGTLIRSGCDVEAVKMTASFDVYPGFAFHTGTYIPTLTNPEEVPEHVKQKLLGDKPYFCVLRQKFLEQAGAALPQNLLTPRMGPMGAKELVLIGNRDITECISKAGN